MLTVGDGDALDAVGDGVAVCVGVDDGLGVCVGVALCVSVGDGVGVAVGAASRSS